MCWGLTLALKDWIHKSFFICAIFSISTGFYCKICFITHNWVKVQFRLINEGFSDTDPCCGQLTPPHITLHHHHHHHHHPVRNKMSLLSLPQSFLTNFPSYYRTKPNGSPSSSMFLNNDNNRLMTQLKINPQVLLWARNSYLLFYNYGLKRRKGWVQSSHL